MQICYLIKYKCFFADISFDQISVFCSLLNEHKNENTLYATT